jgi:general secretion pathway protein C
VAILVADNAPPKAIRVGGEIVPGVIVSEVYPRYVMLSDGGVMKRVDLATDATAGTSLSMRGPGQPGAAPAPGGAAMPQTVPEPPMSPGIVQQGQAPEVAPVEIEQPPAAGGQSPVANQPPPPPPPPPQMPQPMRGSGSPVPQPSSAR